jgi:hypothetical protein
MGVIRSPATRALWSAGSRSAYVTDIKEDA